MKFTEGPVWLPEESKVLFSDIPNSKLMQWSQKGGLYVFRKSEQTNGNILDLQGRIISHARLECRSFLCGIEMAWIHDPTY